MDVENGPRTSPSGITYTPPAAAPPEPVQPPSAREPAKAGSAFRWAWILGLFVVFAILRAVWNLFD